MVEAIKQSFFPQREIAEASFRYQREVESGSAQGRRRQRLRRGRRPEPPLLKIDPALEPQQIAARAGARARRATRRGRPPRCSAAACGTPIRDENLMPYLRSEAAPAEATDGEMVRHAPKSGLALDLHRLVEDARVPGETRTPLRRQNL